MDQRQEAMNHKQDLILQYLAPKTFASVGTPSIAGSVDNYDVANGTAATASGDEMTTASVGEHKLKSDGNKKSSTAGSGSSGEED